MPRILVACEFSGIVTSAFAERGWDAWSCDIIPPEHSGNHFHCDVLDVIGLGWDLMIAHPPCTYLARSGMRWLKDQPPLKSGKPVGAERRKLLQESLEFFDALLQAPIPSIAIENPKSFLIPHKYSQSIQPWQFGHGETKETCLWLKNLPKLKPTNLVAGRKNLIHRMAPSPERAKERSRTYKGIAQAMAEQWGQFIEDKLK